MDCKDWSDSRDEGWKQKLRFFEEALKKIEHVGGDKKPCIEPLQKNIAWLKKQLDIKWCKEDCTSCGIIRERAENGEMIDEFRECKGPNDPKMIEGYPTNSCKKYRLTDIIQGYSPPFLEDACYDIIFLLSGNKKSAHQNRVDDIDREVCTCSTDGCEPPKHSGNPNPSNPNAPNSNPSNTNENIGTTDKNNSDPAIHPSILNYLFIIASFFVIRF